MTGPLLRTGSLKAFQPLGAVGNPVYLAASQLRAAVSRRLGAEAADTFAVPQRNEDGDTIDWYAAQPGSVVPWSAATADERARARDELVDVRDRIDELSRAMQQDASAERQVFGRLLEHVTTFPDDEHVYLVNGAPVVTFWGFLPNDAAVGSDPLLNLDLLDNQAADPPETPRRGRFPWWMWLLLLLLLIPLLFFLLRGCGEEPVPDEHPAEQTETNASDGPSAADDGSAASSDEPLVEASVEDPPIVEPERPAEIVDERTTRRIEIERGPVQLERGNRVTELRTDETVLSPGQSTTEETVVEEETVEQAVSAETDGGIVDGISTEAAEQSMGEAELIDEPGSAGDGVGENGLPMDAEAELPSDAAPETAEVPGADAEDGSTGDGEADAATANETGEAQGEQPVIEAPASDGQGQPEPASPEQPAPAEAEPGAAEPAVGAEPATGTEPATAASTGESLAIPASAVSARSVRFLNGGWRTATSLQDPKTGLPINLEYRLKDGAGKVRLKRHDGSVCEGEVKAGVDGGKLVIDSAGNIVCADGTNFGRPKLECKPGADGKADCRGRYASGETFSVDIDKGGEGEDGE